MVKKSHQSTIHWRVSKRGWINAKYAGSHIVKKDITEIDNVVTFKAKRLRNNNFEPLYEGEFNTINVDEIKLARV